MSAEEFKKDECTMDNLSKVDVEHWWGGIELKEMYSYEVDFENGKRRNYIRCSYNPRTEQFTAMDFRWKKLKSSISVRHYVGDLLIGPVKEYRVEFNDGDTPTTDDKLSRYIMQVMNPTVMVTLTKNTLHCHQTISISYSQEGQCFTVEVREFYYSRDVDTPWARMRGWIHELATEDNKINQEINPIMEAFTQEKNND